MGRFSEGSSALEFTGGGSGYIVETGVYHAVKVVVSDKLCLPIIFIQTTIIQT
jgi:hypothetical protein